MKLGNNVQTRVGTLPGHLGDDTRAIREDMTYKMTHGESTYFHGLQEHLLHETETRLEQKKDMNILLIVRLRGKKI